MATLQGQVESRLTTPVEAVQVALGFLDHDNKPVSFQSVDVTGSFPAQFQLDVLTPPASNVPAFAEGEYEAPETGDLVTYKWSVAQVFVVSADSDLDADPGSVSILGWDPFHLVFFVETTDVKSRVVYDSSYTSGSFPTGYSLAVGNARVPSQYAADTECESELWRAFLEAHHPPDYPPTSTPELEAELRQQVLEQCGGGRSDFIVPAPDGFDTLLTVPMVDDPTTMLGILHPFPIPSSP